MTAPIIVLNGASSSGKTSIGREIQQRSLVPFLYTGLDAVIEGLPFTTNAFVSEPSVDVEWLEWVMAPSGSGITELQLGRRAIAALAAMHRYVAELSRTGIGVIVDHVFHDERIAIDCRETFRFLPTTYVGVKCPLDVLVRREMTRGDRVVGMAKSHYDYVHTFGPYDLEIDTSVTSTGDAALFILDHIGANVADR